MINLLKKELQKENIELEANKLEQLATFADKLLWWNSTHNITGAKDKEAVAANIIDSIIPTTFIKEPKSLLDVGTGAGFPGLILAIIWQNSKVVLAEPLNKRASFLRYISQELGLKNVEIFKNRVEKLKEEPFDLISSRAVTNTKLLIDLTKNISNLNTSYLFFKGERVFDELKELKDKYIYDIVQKDKRNYLWIKGKK